MKVFSYFYPLFTDNKCGGLLTSTKGTFATPNYPMEYPSNSSCLWIIKVPLAKEIRMEYDDFELEESSACKNDRMTIVTIASKEGTKDCGRTVQKKMLMGNIAMVEFASNSVVQKRGFQARYNASLMGTDSTNVKATMTSIQGLLISLLYNVTLSQIAYAVPLNASCQIIIWVQLFLLIYKMYSFQILLVAMTGASCALGVTQNAYVFQ